MKKNKKVTVNLPEELLAKAQRTTKAGLTETIREGLEVLAATSAFENLRNFRGKISLPIDLASLRED